MPNRMLRTRALQSRKLGKVSATAEALYYRLMLLADDFGRYYADPAVIQSHAYSRGERKTARAFEELAEVGAIHTYEVDGEPYLIFDVWDQSVRAKESKFPQPPADVRDRVHVFADAPVVEGEDEDVVEGEDGIAQPFEQFWGIYPRHVGKRKAAEAWKQAIRRGEPDVIIAGAERFRDDPNREDEYTPHPTTWLNRDGWLDEPLPARGRGKDPALRILAAAQRMKEVEHGAKRSDGPGSPPRRSLPG